MADATLHGNHDDCPACALRREQLDAASFTRDAVPCNHCGGIGYLPLTETEIVRRTVEQAHRLYWPTQRRYP